MAYFKPLEKRSPLKRPYSDITRGSREKREFPSPERKLRIIQRPIEISLRKRPFSDVTRASRVNPDYPSPERKRMRKTIIKIPLLKRPFSDVTRASRVNPDYPSPERKRMRKTVIKIPLLKRPFSDVTRASRVNPDFPSPQRKRMRMAASAETPGTSKQGPSAVIRRKSKKKERSRKKTRKTRRTATRIETKIWIIGSSYIRRGETAARENFGENLGGLNAQVDWCGTAGMRWSGVLPRFYGKLSTQSPPDILVVHAGGNDLGLISARVLACQMVRDLKRLHEEFPSMTIAYSCINERQVWSNGHPVMINNERKTVNALMRKAVGSFGGEVVEHPLLRFFNSKLFQPDGVHFTKEGNRIFVSSIRGALEKIFERKKSQLPSPWAYENTLDAVMKRLFI